MHLFISNSESKSITWLMCWLLTAVMCFGSFYAYESFLQESGHKKSIESNKDLWSWYRSKSIGDKNNIVLLGASRMQLDINVAFLKQRYSEYNIIELSLNGQYPVATLKALAEDEDFIGTAVVSINAQALESYYHNMQQENNQYYIEKATLYKSFDAFITSWVQSKWRFLNPLLGLKDIVDFYDKHERFKSVFYVVENLDLSKSGDYSIINKEQLEKHFVRQKLSNYENDKPTAVTKWKENVLIIQQYISAIQQRGGDVILVRLPTDKGHWDLDEKYYPRIQYWDLLNKHTTAKTVHFKDIPALQQFDLPDSSHLDQKDSERFTDILFDHIQLIP